MRYNFLFIIIVFMFSSSCSTQYKVNKVVVDSELNESYFIGIVDSDGLSNYDIFEEADIYYEHYKVDEKVIDKLKDKSKGVSIVVVFGSWCIDSKINVPAFQKIVKEVNFDESKIEYIAVDRNKLAGELNIERLKVNYVPTFIFYKNKKEIGRIIEYPKGKNIEEDWLKIVSE